LLVVCLLAPFASAAPTITLDESSITVTGLNAGAEVVMFSLASVPQGDYLRLRRLDPVLRDEDRDGTVRYSPPGELQFKSTWAAVDLATGELAVATPRGFQARQLELPIASVRRNSAGEAIGLEHGLQAADILFVRPGVGAWGLTVADGGRDDEGAPNDDRIQTSVGRGRRTAPSFAEAPQKLKAGDVILVIDNFTLDLLAIRLTR
jgi:hypothetical protein